MSRGQSNPWHWGKCQRLVGSGPFYQLNSRRSIPVRVREKYVINLFCFHSCPFLQLYFNWNSGAKRSSRDIDLLLGLNIIFPILSQPGPNWIYGTYSNVPEGLFACSWMIDVKHPTTHVYVAVVVIGMDQRPSSDHSTTIKNSYIDKAISSG